MNTPTTGSSRKKTIIGVPVDDDMRSEIEQLATARRWSKAEATRYLIELGFAADARRHEEAAA